MTKENNETQLERMRRKRKEKGRNGRKRRNKIKNHIQNRERKVSDEIEKQNNIGNKEKLIGSRLWVVG